MKNRKNNITAKAILASAAVAGLLGGSAARLQAGQTDSNSTTTMAGQLGDLTDFGQGNYYMRAYSCGGSSGGGMASGGKKGHNHNNAPAATQSLVQSINASANTIVVSDKDSKTTHTYTIDLATTITVNGNAGTLNDIKPGMQVLSSTERDSSTLDSISVGIADPAPANGKGKKGKGMASNN